MKKLLVVGSVAAVVIGGGVVYLLTNNGSNGQSQDSSQSGNNNMFVPASTEGLDFSANISVNGPDGSYAATLEQDGNKARYVGQVSGQQQEIIYTPDATYICSDGQCFKYPSSGNNTGVNINDYTYDDQELLGYKDASAYKGRQGCPAGSCDVWSVTVEGATTMLYIDTDTRRISLVESKVGDTTTKVTYDYKDVTVTVPENAQEFPGI